MNTDVVLFEDHLLDRMNPVTLTRPAFAVTCGCYNLWQISHILSSRVSHVVREYLAPICRRDYPQTEPGSGPTLFLNASVAPDVRNVEKLRGLVEKGEPFLCTSGERVAAALVPADVELPEEPSASQITPFLLNLGLPVHEDELFVTIDYPFEIVKYHPELFPENLAHKLEAGEFQQVQPDVFAGDGVEVADNAVFHTEEGPILLADGVKVLDFAYLQGPLYVGPKSKIIERSSVKELTCVGHTCKVGGEVEESVIEPYSNKQHHGFLGHAYVGSWVNLGAGTSNSDLKNTYGEVRYRHKGRRVETGMQFLGCIIGDYTKSAINTSIFTGKVIGVASMLYGFVGKNVPSFTNYAKSFGQVTECSLGQCIITQRRMFGRRDVEQTEEDTELLKCVFEMTEEERRISDEPPVF